MQQLSLIPVCEKCGTLKVQHKRSDRKSGYRWRCPACQSAYNRLPRVAAVSRACSARWKKANPERAAASPAAWRKENPERQAALSKQWRQDNPGQWQSLLTARHNRCNVEYKKLDPIDKAICSWFYKQAKKRNLVVDHIHPVKLQGQHAPWNFQLLTWAVNRAKGANRPTLREVMRGERRYRLLRRIFENAVTLGAAA